MAYHWGQTGVSSDPELSLINSQWHFLECPHLLRCAAAQKDPDESWGVSTGGNTFPKSAPAKRRSFQGGADTCVKPD